MGSFYVTTPIYYPSANMHIGNAFPTVIADILARFHRLIGDDVFFLTGTDEHGEKIETLARQSGVTPKEFVDKIVADTQQLWRDLLISNTDFIRTTQERHHKCVTDCFQRLLEKGDIYLGKYAGKYCKPCESFWTEVQAKDGLCPDCHRPTQDAEEEAYFFKVTKYADRLIEAFNQEGFIAPDKIKKEMLTNFIQAGLTDLCISRSTEWGIKVPGDETKSIYVWFDALINYISGLAGPDSVQFKHFWHKGEVVHLAGKEIARFHLIYWPMFLMALDLPLPAHIMAHGWLIINGGKVGKSLGNAVNPKTLITRYGADALRFFYAQLDFLEDNPYTHELFLQTINNYLVNDLGNMLRRTLSMINKYFDGVIPAATSTYPIFTNRMKTIRATINCYQDRQINKAVGEIFQLLDQCNKLIEAEKPWEMVKENQEGLKSLMFTLADALRIVGVLLKPITPTLSSKIFTQLGLPEQGFNDLVHPETLSGKTIALGEVLYQRIDIAKELEEIDA